MNLQEVFDQTVRHLFRQGGPSKRRRPVPYATERNSTICAYRGDGGRCCSVGYWISEDRYSIDLEGKALFNLVTRTPVEEVVQALPSELRGLPILELLRELQNAHDVADLNEGRWATGDAETTLAARLRSIAERHGLEQACLPLAGCRAS